MRGKEADEAGRSQYPATKRMPGEGANTGARRNACATGQETRGIETPANCSPSPWLTLK